MVIVVQIHEHMKKVNCTFHIGELYGMLTTSNKSVENCSETLFAGLCNILQTFCVMQCELPPFTKSPPS